MARITREQWGARPPKAVTRISLPSKGITNHWEGPHMGPFDHSQCPAKVRAIQRFHQVNRGWADIAYSMIVCPHGDVFEGRGVRNRTAANGTNSGNAGWHAVCYLGGENDPFTDAGKRGMRDAHTWLREGGAGPGVNCHSDHRATACPGGAIRDWTRAGMPAPAAPTPPPQPQPTPTPTPTPPKPAGDDMDRLPILRRGGSNPTQAVRNWQGLLLAAGRPVTVDGDFGPNTERLTKEWQAAARVSGGADGIVGPNTWGRALGLR